MAEKSVDSPQELRERANGLKAAADSFMAAARWYMEESDKRQDFAFQLYFEAHIARARALHAEGKDPGEFPKTVVDLVGGFDDE